MIEDFKFNRFNRGEAFLLFIFLFTIMSGFFRKWFFTTGAIGNVIFLAQLLVSYAILFIGKGYVAPWRNRALFSYFLYLFFASLNPLNLTIFHGLFGWIIHLIFFFLIYFYFDNRHLLSLKILVPYIVFVIFGEFVLAFVQYQLPSDHWLNTYANNQIVGFVSLVGDSVRVTGTFSYLSGFTAFIFFVAFFIWYLVRIGFNDSVTAVLYLCGLFGSFMSGSRQAVGVYLIISILILLSEYSIDRFFSLIKNLSIPLVVVISVLLIRGDLGVEGKLLKSFDNFEKRRIHGKDSGEEEFRILWDFYDVIDFKGKHPVFGLGLGSTYQGATALFGTSDYLREYGYYENEFTRIVLEGGFILLLIRFVLLVHIVRKINVNRLCKSVLLLLFFYFLPIVFNVYNAILLALGLMFLDNSKFRKV